MNQLSSSQIRTMFLEFFKEKDHQVEPSASLIPKNDPTLLWINSGVATLKKYFDGTVIPENPRLVNVQKSIRTNDIENVGFTARHHTFFEMLGNFSIGDYFKKEAIEWAWEFLTSKQWIGFNKDLLSVTIHPDDDEAYHIWLNDIKIPADRIIRLEENFWDIGVGPSGPNTEIFYDRGEEYGNDPNDQELFPGGENDRYLEIWNLVFSQFNHNPDGSYTPLPKKNIDTGMGLERVVSIIQDVSTNFETDLFLPLIKEVEKLASTTYGRSTSSDTAFKVIADHVRTVSFAVGDGALPSNEGRGYVLRRLLRRAVRFAIQIGIDKPFMYKLVTTVGNIMEDFYPEVVDKSGFIKNIIKLEEERFHETLHDGLEILTTMMKKEKENNSTILPGVEVFKLYDTYGFPKELTEEYVAEEGFSIDEEGFFVEMAKQQDRARSARKQTDSMHVQDEILGTLETTSLFVGYEQQEVKTTIATIIKDNRIEDSIKSGEDAILILDKTPFYAESGGQVADLGKIYCDGAVAEIKDVTTAPKGQHLHYVHVQDGAFEVGQKATAVIDKANRSEIVKNHTATHLLHQALRDILGEHVTQAGSLVSDDHLRFDFTHFQSVSDEELEKTEQMVNEKIFATLPVIIANMHIDEAKEMGAMALFGEKYGDQVRVVQVDNYSVELCGGCHVKNTSEINLFNITSESGIGAGTRRIEAVTGKKAYTAIQEKMKILQTTANQLKSNEEHIPKRISSLFEEIDHLKRANHSLSAKLSNLETPSIQEQVQVVDDVALLSQKVNASDMNQLRNMVDDLKQSLGSSVVLLAAESNNKVLLSAGITQDLIDRGLHAGKLIKQVAEICDGGGGGRPDMAQAGGKEPQKIEKALKYAKNYVSDNIRE